MPCVWNVDVPREWVENRCKSIKLPAAWKRWAGTSGAPVATGRRGEGHWVDHCNSAQADDRNASIKVPVHYSCCSVQQQQQQQQAVQEQPKHQCWAIPLACGPLPLLLGLAAERAHAERPINGVIDVCVCVQRIPSAFKWPPFRDSSIALIQWTISFIALLLPFPYFSFRQWEQWLIWLCFIYLCLPTCELMSNSPCELSTDCPLVLRPSDDDGHSTSVSFSFC